MRRWSTGVALIIATLGLGGCGAGADYMSTCASNADCFEGYTCAAEAAGADTDICLRACSAQLACLDSQYCDIASGETSGVCRPGSAP